MRAFGFFGEEAVSSILRPGADPGRLPLTNAENPLFSGPQAAASVPFPAPQDFQNSAPRHFPYSAPHDFQKSAHRSPSCTSGLRRASWTTPVTNTYDAKNAR